MPRRETSLLPFPEDEAARIVERAIADALREMEAVVLRYAKTGRPIDSRMIAQIINELDELANAYAVRTIKSRWGQMLRDAAREGAEHLDESNFRITRDMVAAVLNNNRASIKNLLDAAIPAINTIIVRAKIAGGSLASIAADIHDAVKIGGRAVPWWRAEMIARNELFSTYRMFSRAAAKSEGIDLYQMTGPLDSRTTAICARYVGKVKTAAEWLGISKTVFQYGLHYNCRHSWDPVRDAEAEEVRAIADAMAEQRERLKEAA